MVHWTLSVNICRNHMQSCRLSGSVGSNKVKGNYYFSSCIYCNLFLIPRRKHLMIRISQYSMFYLLFNIRDILPHFSVIICFVWHSSKCTWLYFHLYINDFAFNSALETTVWCSLPFNNGELGEKCQFTLPIRVIYHDLLYRYSYCYRSRVYPPCNFSN